MDSEDDICVLLQPAKSNEETVEVAAHPIIPFSPVSPTSSSAFDWGGPHHALQKAYIELKRRLNKSNSQNLLLLQRIKTLESVVPTERVVQSKMEETATNSPAEAGLQQAAEEGFATNLQRQLVRTRFQLQAVETKYQEKVQETDHKLSALRQQLQIAMGKMEELNQENLTLKQKCEDERLEKEAAMRTVKELREKCDCLELEKDKLLKGEVVLQSSLNKTHQLASLEEKQVELGMQETPLEMAAEVAYMRNVIRNLRDMVLAQREHLGNCGKALSMSSHPRSFQSSPVRSMMYPSSVESDTSPQGSAGRSVGSQSTQSWEMVNIPRPASLNTRQQQQQQQQQQLMAMQQRCVTSTASNVVSPPHWNPQGAALTKSAVMGEAMVNGGVDAGRATITNDVVSPKLWGSQSVVIPRPQSQIPAVQPKSKSEVVRPRTTPPFPRSEDWIDGTQHPVLGGGGTSQPAAARLDRFQQMTAGLNQFPLDMVALTEPGAAQSKLSPVPSVYPPPHQSVLFKDPSGVCNADTYNTSAPSMHILNPGVMAGARVIQNNSDSFGSSGGTTLTNQVLPGFPAPIRNVNMGSSTPQPQEHTDITEFNGPAMSELSPLNEQSNFRNAPVNVMNQVANGLDRKCPVCGQDFSHISMDEFQTHVFECFDNAEENSSAPETLQPKPEVQPAPDPAGRVCPMCEKTFLENTSQQFFEGHVQSHFEVATDQFEVLDVKDP